MTFTDSHRVALVGIAALGAALRLYDLDGQGFWVDEGWSSLMAQPGNWRYWPVNEHPPLFYALLSLWGQVSQTDYWLRLLPAALGIGTIPVVYLLGRHLFDEGVGLLAALLMAVAGFHIRYSRDLTAYALETLLFAATLLALVVASRRMATTPAAANGAWASYALLGSLLAYSQGIAPMYVALIAVTYPVFTGARWGWTAWKPWLIANAVIAVAFLPWAGTHLARIQDISGDFWVERPTPLDPILAVYDLTVASIPSLEQITQAKFGIAVGGFGAPWLWALPIYLLLSASILAGTRLHKRQTLALTVLALAPIAIVYAVSIAIRPIFVSRQLIPAIVPLVLLLALGIKISLPAPNWRTIAAVALVGLLSLSTVYHLRYMQKEDWRRAASEVHEKLQVGDALLYYTYGVPLGGPAPHLIARYGTNAAVSAAPQILVHRVIKECSSALDTCLDSAAGVVSEGAIVWAIESHEKYVPAKTAVTGWIDTRFQVLEEHEFLGVRVRKLRPRR